jgi:hypothetical protein
MRKRVLVIASLMLLTITGMSAYAKDASDFITYSTTVPRFNGSGYTSYETKVLSSEDAQLQSDIVGGDYVVDARVQASKGTGAWERNVDDNDFRYLDNSVQSANQCRVQFSNDLTTSVNVQVEGSWACY